MFRYIRDKINAEGGKEMTVVTEKDPVQVAKTLSRADVWIIPQPKEATIGKETFDLTNCSGIHIGGAISPKGAEVLADFPTLLEERSGVALETQLDSPDEGCIVFGVFPDGIPGDEFKDVSTEDLEALGEEGYVLHIGKNHITAAARETTGLYYAARTLAQIATDRSELPCLKIRDWPSLRHRGFLQDVSRGQIPTMNTFKRLVRVLAEAKYNMLELYIEHVFKWSSHPDISPPEGISPQEGRELFDYGARHRIDVHPLLQTCGHSYHILENPAYEHLRVRYNTKKPGATTFDIRKPETIEFMTDLVQDLVKTFPGKFLGIDFTEIDIEGFTERQVSENHGISLGTVKSRKNIGLRE